MNILGLARHGLNTFEQLAIIGVVLTAFLSLWYAWMLRGSVLKKGQGDSKNAGGLGCHPHRCG
jgi:K(+)-stimulated pyrophosphate-energized sodium pump